jgi:hypothetical protein
MLSAVMNGKNKERAEKLFREKIALPPKKSAETLPIPKWADNVEVQGVSWYEDMQAWDAPSDDPDIYTVYWHGALKPGFPGGLKAVADFRTAAEANAYARVLADRLRAKGQLEYKPYYA